MGKRYFMGHFSLMHISDLVKGQITKTLCNCFVENVVICNFRVLLSKMQKNLLRNKTSPFFVEITFCLTPNTS